MQRRSKDSEKMLKFKGRGMKSKKPANLKRQRKKANQRKLSEDANKKSLNNVSFKKQKGGVFKKRLIKS